MHRGRSLLLICFLLCAAGSSRSQEEPRAAWQVSNYDITVTAPGVERTLAARAIVTVRNVGLGSGSTLTLRINSKAEIKEISVGGSPATYKSLPESRGGVQRITINLPGTVGSNQTIAAALDYRLPMEDNAGTAAISPVAFQFLPLSSWYPSPSTTLAVRGPDYAPFRLTINGVSAISSGIDKSAAGNSIFEQPLNAQPFFVMGQWDQVEGTGNAKGVTAYLLKGTGADERKQADALIAFAGDARSFFANALGAAPEVPVRLVSVARGGGFDSSGTILLGEGAFGRKKVDSVTALAVAEAIARLWIGAESPVRGEGYGVVREGLARFLATTFIEKEFGPEAAEAERARQRLAYSSIVKRDGPLSRTTPLDNTYFNSVANKGAMVWRLVDHAVGRDVFMATLHAALAAAKTAPEGLTLSNLRSSFSARGGASLKAVLDYEMDQPTELDLMVGLPHLEGGQWVTALRNLGAISVTVNVAGVSDGGQVSNNTITIAAHDFGQAVFRSASKIVRAEVDPEKFYPQVDYGNDSAPRTPEVAGSLADATRLLGAQEYAKAEALMRELLATTNVQEGRIILARALLAENKTEEAEREFKQLAAERLPTPAALAWSSIGFGEIALKRGQAAEAARNFTDAVRADAEYASTLTARSERIRAEAAANSSPPLDEAVRRFINQLDTALRSGRQNEIAPLIVPGELTKFVRAAVGTQPEVWQTRILRAEQLDANRMALDVALNTKQLGVEHSSTAVFVLARVAGNWRLEAIEFFEEK